MQLKHIPAALALAAAILAGGPPAVAAGERTLSREAALPNDESWNARDFDKPLHSQVLGSDLIGRKVVNRRNETIGSVDDLVIGLEGRVSYLIIAYGGFFGIGADRVAVPFAVVDQKAGDEGDIMLDISREDLARAPAFDPVEDWPDFGDPGYENKLQKYFGRSQTPPP